MTYPSPLDQLLTLGEPGRLAPADAWPDYRALGLGPEHVPDLIRLATDPALNQADSESAAVWAPLHAWRALGQLRAVEAVQPLLGLLDTDPAYDDDPEMVDDWAAEELPEVFTLIGPPALPALFAFLQNPRHRLFAHLAVARAVQNLAEAYPDEARQPVLAVLRRLLSDYANNDPALNGFIIVYLVELQDVEAAPLMEQAFAAGAVDEMASGDWEDVQIELGLKTERDTEPRSPFVLLDEVPPAQPPPRPVPPEIQAWNAAVEARQRQKDQARIEKAGKGGKKKKKRR